MKTTIKSIVTRVVALALTFITGSALAVDAPTPVAVWNGNFTGAKAGVVSGKYILKANGNTIAADGSSIEISQNVGVLVDWKDRSDFSTAGNITVLVKYSDYTIGENNGTPATLWAGGNGSNNNLDIVGPFTTASSGILNNIWNGAADGRGTKADKVLPASGVFSFDFSGNTEPKGSTTYIENNGVFEQACSGNGTLFTTTTDIYGLAVGGSRNAYSNLKAITGMKILGVAIFNSRLTPEQLAAYEWPAQMYTYTNVDSELSNSGGQGDYGLKSLTIPTSCGLPAGTELRIKSISFAQQNNNYAWNKSAEFITVDGIQSDSRNGNFQTLETWSLGHKLTYTFSEDVIVKVGQTYTMTAVQGNGSYAKIRARLFSTTAEEWGYILLDGSMNAWRPAYQIVAELAPVIPTSTATISEDTNWSDIQWDPAVEDFSKVKLALTVENNAKITLDKVAACRDLAITGNATFVAADGLYEDGCWEKKIFSAKNSFTTTGTISFGALKDGFYGAYTKTEDGILLRAQNKEVISINIAGGNDGGAGADSPAENLVSGTGFYGIAPTVGDSWNNINRQWTSGGNQTIAIDSPNAYDGNAVIARPTMSLSATGKNTWQAGSIANPFLRGYLDDGNGVTVEVHGVPYTEYDVIVYATSDSAGIALAPVTINGKQYTFKNGATTEGSDVWGQGLYATPEIGKNALRVNGCTGDTITINATRTGGRATLCAVQVINKGEVVLKEDFSATITDSIKFSEITWDDSKTFKDGQLNEVVITVGEGTDEEVNLTFDNPDMMLAKITVVSSRPVRFTAAKALSNVGQFIDTGCTGGIVYAWPVSALTTSADGMIYAGGAGSATAAAPITFAVANGSMTLKDATYYIGTSFSGVQSTINMINATVFANGNMGLGIGQANFNLSGTTKLTSEKVVLSQGADGYTANLTLSDSAEIVVTGSSIVDSNQSSILFGHWNGPSTFTMNDNAKFTAENAQVLVGLTRNNQTININGGVFTAKGIKTSNRASGTNVLNLNGGELKLGEAGISSYSTTTISVTVDGEAKITSTAAMPITQALTINADKTLTLDATAGDITISGAVVNNGTIKVVGGNVIFMPGTANGTIVEEGGKAIYGYIVNINDFGKFKIPEGKAVENIRLFDGAGNVIAFTDNKDGTVSYEWEITGGACWWDYEFDGNLNNVGTSGHGAMTQWGVNPAYTDGEGNKSLYIHARPAIDLGSWPTTATFVMYSKMVNSTKMFQLGFGSSTKGTQKTIFLATEDSLDKVSLNYGEGQNKSTKLCTMTVPNAQATEHLYAFVLKEDDTQTIIDIYLDGELLQSYPFGSKIALGGGFQIGSPHGGMRVGYAECNSADDLATLDWLRVYDVELSKEVLEKYAVLYPYVSPNGSYQRTVTADANWSATDAWTKEGTEPAETADEPAADATVKLAIDNDDATTTIDINLAADVTYEAIQINGDDVKFVLAEGDELGGIVKSTGRVTANANITFAYDAFSMENAPLTVKQGKTVTFDLSMVDMTKFFSTQTYDLTGYLTLEDGAKVTFIVPEDLHGRTASAAIDDVTKHYVLTVTAPDYAFVYENGTWTWGTQVVDEETINAHPEVLRSIKSDLEMALGTSDYSVENGVTLKQADASATGTITVNAGGTFDVNGVIDTALKVVLNGGSLINDGSDIGTGKKQYVSITQTAGSTIGGSGEFGYVLIGYGANTLDLGGATLTKTGDNTFSLCNATVQNGTLKIAAGTLATANEAVTIADTATIEGVEGAVLSVGSSISDFTLTGALKLAGAGTFGTITLDDDAALDIATVRGLTVAGEGTIKATITAAEMATGSLTVFTKAAGATISTVTLVNESGTELTGYTADYDEDGNYIADFTITFTVPAIVGATASINVGTLSGETATVVYGKDVIVTYTAGEGKLFTNGEATKVFDLGTVTTVPTIDVSGIETTAKLPTAEVEQMNPIPDGLDDAATFTAGEESKLYSDWKADFIFSATADFAKDSITLKGLVGEDWIALPFAEDYTAGEKISVLGMIPEIGDYKVTYPNLIEMGTFSCGLVKNGLAKPLTVTIDLVLTKDGQDPMTLATYDVAIEEDKVEITQDSNEHILAGIVSWDDDGSVYFDEDGIAKIPYGAQNVTVTYMSNFYDNYFFSDGTSTYVFDLADEVTEPLTASLPQGITIGLAVAMVSDPEHPLNSKFYPALADAIERVDVGGTISMIGDDTASTTVAKSVTIDVNGYEINVVATAEADTTITFGCGGTVGGTVTVDGGTVNFRTAGDMVTGEFTGTLVYKSGTVTKSNDYTVTAPAGYEWKDGVLTAIYPEAEVKAVTPPEELDFAFEYTAKNDAPLYNDSVASFILTANKAIPAGAIKIGGKFADMGWNIYDLPSDITEDGSFTVVENIPWSQVKAVSPFTCGAKSISLTEDTEVTLTLKLDDKVIDTQTITLKAKAIEPVDPEVPQTYDSPEKAEAAAAAINANKEAYINAPDGIVKAAYVKLFEAVVSGTTVAVQLTTDAEAAIKEDLANPANEATILTPDENGEATIAAKPGLYYGIVAEDSLDKMADATGKNWIMATGDTVKVPVPTVTDADGNKAKAAFFRPTCSAKAPTK